MTGPLYSYDPDTSGPGGGPGSMVMSIACAEGRCGECEAWFRCDHGHHRRQAGSPPDDPGWADAYHAVIPEERLEVSGEWEMRIPRTLVIDPEIKLRRGPLRLRPGTTFPIPPGGAPDGT